ncbi:MAG: MFS transporter [Nocardioides sp.]
MTAAAGSTKPPEISPEMQRERRAWYWYDWANSAFYTTVLTVVFGPLMVTVAGRAAGCGDDEDPCSKTVTVLGLHLAAGSLPSYLMSFATIASAFLLPIVGAMVDRSGRKKMHMAWFAWSGSFFAALLFFLQGDNWELAAVAVVVASILCGCSLIAYYAMLTDIATEEDRDLVSARGWAFGYLGGGVLLVVNLGMVLGHTALGLEEEMAARLALLSAAIWWAAFTIIPVRGLRNRPPVDVEDVEGGLVRRGFGQLIQTLKEMRAYPMTLTFLVAYLFYNDGIQTVIVSAAIYGDKQLGFETEVLIGTIVMIQFVAFGGALAFGRLAQRFGAYNCLLAGAGAWMVIVVVALFLPAGQIVPFMLVGIAIALVMGGTQALFRSFFSLLIPPGKEGAYFALYAAAERGTSWLGTLVFGLVFQLTGSYRPALGVLIVFFVIGGALLLRVDPKKGIEQARIRV